MARVALGSGVVVTYAADRTADGATERAERDARH